MINVVKIGGNVVDNPEALEQFLDIFAALEGPKVLAHGGGKIATKIAAALGIETQMIEGRRVTDAETIKVVTMVYAGLVNKSIVSKLQARGVNGLGLSGADGNVIKSHKRTGSTVDYGFVGDVDRVDGDFLLKLIAEGKTPVMAPITHDGNGLLLNTNADTVASKVAVALGQSKSTRLNYCFELTGVLKDINDESSLIPQINPAEYAELKANGIVAGGMIPKLDNCFDAIADGVAEVRICKAENLAQTAGTTLIANG